MHSLWIFLLQIIYISQCVYSDDVGPSFDPTDGEAWETKYGDYPFMSFKSTDLTSPVVRRMVDSPQCYDGRYMFYSPRGVAPDLPAPMILDDKGDLVWTKRCDGLQPYNFEIQEYQGKQHLTFWLGNDAVGGHGEGFYYMLDSSYKQVAKIAPLNGFRADLHELTLTANGTAIISIYQSTHIEAWGRRVYIWDCLFQEIDLATNELVFEWRASEHHTLDETYSSIGSGGRSSGSPWDWYHMNSVQKDELGNFFVSARYTHTLTYIDGQSGDIIWILGGKRNMFNDLSDGAATDFASQHFARMHELTDMPVTMSREIKAHKTESKANKTEKLVSLFDNGADDRTRAREYSRGILVQINYPSDLNTSPQLSDEDMLRAYTVRLVQRYDHPNSISANSQGSFQLIPSLRTGRDPTIGIGYGQKPVFTEYSASGQVLCDTHFAPQFDRASVQSYRVFKSTWIGRPSEPPKAVIDEDDYIVYVSWNGATEVKSWQLQHTNHPKSNFKWQEVTTVAKHSFETELTFDAGVKQYFRVVAIDCRGEVLGTSNVMDFGEYEDYPKAWDPSNGTSFTAGNDIISLEIFDNPSLRLVMFFLCAITFGLTAYGCYRQYSSWQRNKRQGYNRLGHMANSASLA